MNKKCEKHGIPSHGLVLSNGRYSFCMDCIAEWIIAQGIKDLATKEEKEESLINKDTHICVSCAKEYPKCGMKGDDIRTTPIGKDKMKIYLCKSYEEKKENLDE